MTIVKRYLVFRRDDDRLVASFDRRDALNAYMFGLPKLEYLVIDGETGEEVSV